MRILLATPDLTLVSLIQRALRRWHYDWVHADNGFDAFQKAISGKFDLLLLDFELPRMKAIEILRRLHSVPGFNSPPVLVLTLSEKQREEIENKRFPRTDVMAKPLSIRQFIQKILEALHHEIYAACLGGGTGLFTLLSGLKTLPNIRITSIVSMSDDGGSTGKLRDLFGILPPGDIRRSLVALSTAPDLLNELMQYRFKGGREFKGHNLGNLLLTALAERRGSMSEAVKTMGEILNLQGQVVPVTETVNTLKAELENGSILEGEHRIDLFEGINPKVRIRRLWQEPPVKATREALAALSQADFIILGPGDLFTSVISNLIVQGIPQAIVKSQAKKIYICNIMTKPGETTDFEVNTHTREMIKYLGKDCLDYVLASSTVFSPAPLRFYAKKGQIPVVERERNHLSKVSRARFIWADIASEHELVRHDSLKLAAQIRKIMQKESRR